MLKNYLRVALRTLRKQRGYAAINVLVNYWYGTLDTRFPFAALMLAMHSIRELPQPEKDAWRGWFDHYAFGEDAADAVSHLPTNAQGVLSPPSADRDRMILDYVIGMLATAAKR